MGQWVKVWHAGGEKTGRSFSVVDDNLQEKWMEKAGFVDIEVKDLFCPYGAWPEDPRETEAGILSRAAFENDMVSFSVLYRHFLFFEETFSLDRVFQLTPSQAISFIYGTLY